MPPSQTVALAEQLPMSNVWGGAYVVPSVLQPGLMVVLQAIPEAFPCMLTDRRQHDVRGLIKVALSGTPQEIIPLLQLVCRIADRSPVTAEQARMLSHSSCAREVQCLRVHRLLL